MHRRIIAVAAVVAALGGLTAAPAMADNGQGAGLANSGSSNVLFTASLGGLTGTRVLFNLPVSTPNLATANQSNGTISGSYSVGVQEIGAKGANPWEVDQTLVCSAVDTACNTNSPRLWDAADSTSIPASALAGSGATSLAQALGTAGVDDIVNAGGTLDSVVRVFRNTGENTADFYTVNHTGTAPLTLTPPNGTKSGSYTGTIQVTLWQ